MILPLILTGCLWLISVFEIKLLIITWLGALVFKRNLQIPQRVVFWLLLTIFTFAFIYSPYWQIAVRSTILKYTGLTALYIYGLWWSAKSASQIKLPLQRIGFMVILFTVSVLYLITYKALAADIPFRGDEDFHIKIILNLIDYLRQNHFVIILSAALVIFLILKIITVKLTGAWKFFINCFTFLLIPVSAALLYPAKIFQNPQNPLLLRDVLRYPFWQKWLNLFFLGSNFYSDIRLYRLVPFLSLAVISVFLFNRFNKKLNNAGLSLGLALVLTANPVFLYYGSLLYMEMPLIAVMLICLFNYSIILQNRADALKANCLWILLLLSGFLKETVVSFLGIIVISRILFQVFIRKPKTLTLKYIFRELEFDLLMMSPAIIYMFLRIPVSTTRPYVFDIRKILDIANYLETAQALLTTQLGILVPIAILGLLIFFNKLRRGKLNQQIFLSCMFFFVSMLWFILGDGVFYMESFKWNIGYSRSDLYLAPFIIFAAYFFVISVKRPLQVAVLILIIVSNILIFPFNRDGLRQSNWGSPYVNTAEWIYPYDKSIDWLSAQPDVNKVLILGQNTYYTGLDYYWRKYNFFPETQVVQFEFRNFDKAGEQEQLTSFFKTAAVHRTDTILFHSVNNLDLEPGILYGDKFRVSKRFNNGLNSLYIFQTE